MNFKSYTVHEVEELSRNGVYAIVNKVNHKFYIGSASRVKENRPSASGFYARWGEHVNDLNSNTHYCSYLQRSWNKYGADNFEFRIIHFCLPEECIQFEQLYLNFLCPHYNGLKTAGSPLGCKRSEETKEKLRVLQSEKFSLVSPEGVLVEGTNLKQFCIDQQLNYGNTNGVRAGKVFHSQGWTLNLETHTLYKKAYENRGIHYQSAKNGRQARWCVGWKEKGLSKSKSFIEKEKAFELRDSLIREGYNFTITVRNWKEKLKNATQK